MQTLHLKLLGAPQISLNEEPVRAFVTRKAQALLIYVAVTQHAQSREALAGLFWGDLSDEQARNNLRRVLPNLRQLVGDHLRIDRQQVAFDRLRPYTLDIENFVTALRPLLADRESSPGLSEQLQTALALYQGDFLAGFSVDDAPEFETWALLQREHLRQMAIQGYDKLAGLYLEAQQFTAALTATNQLLTLEPWYEAAHHKQIMLLAQSGQRLAALAHYEQWRQTLTAEFSAQPAPALTALYEQLRADEGDLARQGDRERASEQQSQIQNRPSTIIAWGGVPRAAPFFGRESELAQLEAWLLHEQCTLIALLGVGGVGKTALATHLVRNLLGQVTPQPHAPYTFERILWSSLLNAPPLASVLRLWLHELSNGQLTAAPTDLDEQLALLFDQLRQQRCLLVLDNLESILQAGKTAGDYLSGYESYGLLLQRMGEVEHRSCLLFTSRELPLGVARLERTYPVVRSLCLEGLPAASGIELLQAVGLHTAPPAMQALVQRYSGNPLALQLVAEIVLDYYQGNTEAFLSQETLIFEDIRNVLDQQFDRLSAVEREILFWLTIEREPISAQELAENFVGGPPGAPSSRALLEALRSLHRRSLVERESLPTQTPETSAARFSLQNVVLEYSTARLCALLGAEVCGEALDGFLRYALVKAQATDYVRAAQTRLLLQPVAQRLLGAGELPGATTRLNDLLQRLHRLESAQAGYGAANLLHLATYVGVTLEGWDFSRLPIRQADLRNGRLARINFTEADFAHVAFLEKFDVMLTVTFSGDGALLAAGGASGNVHLWRVRDHQLLAVCPGTGRWVWAVAFSPRAEGTRQVVASAGSDCKVHLWEVTEPDSPGLAVGATALRHHQLAGHTDTIFGLAFHPDGQWLVSASADQTIRLWDVARQELVQTLTGHTATVYAVAFHPDGHLLASASRDHTVRLWQVASGVCLQVLAGHEAPVVALRFSQDGRWLMSASTDNCILVWRICTQAAGKSSVAQPERTLINDAPELTALALSPDGETIATNGPNTTIRLWRRAEGTLLNTCHGHTEMVQSLAFHPNGKTLVSGGWDQAVRFWDVATGYPLRTVQGYTNAVNSLALNATGQTLVSGNADGVLNLWLLPTQRLIQVLAGHSGSVQTVAFHPDGSLLASGGGDSILRLWTLADGQLRGRQTLRGHSASILHLCFSPSGHWLASSSADQTVRIWETQTGNCLRVLRGHTHPVQAISFSPDGEWLLSGSDDGRVYRWPVAEGEQVCVPQPFSLVPGGCSCLACSPDGALVAGAGPDHMIWLWVAASGEPLMTFATPVNSTVYALVFRPNQRQGAIQLASSSGTGAICIWELDLNGGRPTLRTSLTEHRGSVRSLQFTPDGETLISGGADEQLKLWAMETLTCLATLPLEQPYVGMDITAATGLTTAQRMALRALGACE